MNAPSEPVSCPSCGASHARGTKYCGGCGARLPVMPPAPAADPLIGQLIAGRFQILDKLGEGGMGVVYRAEQRPMRRPVALKVLHPSLGENADLVARFQNEAAACAKLQHPNTVIVYDFGLAEQGMLYIAMEFLKGEALERTIRKGGAMPWQRAFDIAIQVCGSLADAHDAGIIHRDLKPDNIMLMERAGRKDFVKVLDFGIAKIRHGDGDDADQRQALTKTGMVFGTPQYMSPEQIRGEQVDGRTDVYAMGVILYEMLTGKLPFQSGTPMGLLTKHLTESPRPPSQEIAAIPQAVEKIVLMCLAKEREGRFATMQALTEALASTRASTGGSGAFAAASPPSEQGPIKAISGVAATVAAPATPAPGPGGFTPGPSPMPSATGGSSPAASARSPLPAALTPSPAPVVSTPLPERSGGGAVWILIAAAAIVLLAGGATLAYFVVEARSAVALAPDAGAADGGLASVAAGIASAKPLGSAGSVPPIADPGRPATSEFVCELRAAGDSLSQRMVETLRASEPALRACLVPALPAGSRREQAQLRYLVGGAVGGAPGGGNARQVELSGIAPARPCLESVLSQAVHPPSAEPVTVTVRLDLGAASCAAQLSAVAVPRKIVKRAPRPYRKPRPTFSPK